MPFQVIFERVTTDSPEERIRVKEKLIEKFKVPAEKAERMVSAAPIVVKKGLTEDQAQKYKTALKSIGVEASIRPEDGDQSLSAAIPINSEAAKEQKGDSFALPMPASSSEPEKLPTPPPSAPSSP